MIASLRLVVDLRSSMNRITRETNTSTSPISIGQLAPEAVRASISTRPIWSWARTLLKPCGADSASRL